MNQFQEAGRTTQSVSVYLGRGKLFQGTYSVPLYNNAETHNMNLLDVLFFDVSKYIQINDTAPAESNVIRAQKVKVLIKQDLKENY